MVFRAHEPLPHVAVIANAQKHHNNGFGVGGVPRVQLSSFLGLSPTAS